MSIKLPSYRSSIDCSPRNYGSKNEVEFQSGQKPVHRYSFIKFNIAEGIPSKNSLKATRESLEQLAEREASFAQPYRPTTKNSFRHMHEIANSPLTEKGISPHYLKNMSSKSKYYVLNN